MKILLVALRDHSYGGRRIKAGQQYATHYRHGADVLVKLGHAALAPEPDPLPPAVAAALEPEPTYDYTAELSPITGKPKRQYRRRDMTAEG